MESNQLEDSKSSSEDTDDIRTGRSYECVFCRRGFTTAQALGGHMNIHRKESQAAGLVLFLDLQTKFLFMMMTTTTPQNSDELFVDNSQHVNHWPRSTLSLGIGPFDHENNNTMGVVKNMN
ncbi:basic helix-loop-helix family protein [Hibiscus syriacus]|uniref:Basic helix-loop-helix family protein n=1 Tax=Hibiscus syriacus TaxID=106335 RepID=A0A6A2Z4Q0_HIBSY|nr:basic helix-loop-helix family protein [Hibiscus syriacus]